MILALLLSCAEPCEESFSLQDELSAGQVAEVRDAHGLQSAGQVTCEQVCTAIYQAALDSTVTAITTCDMALDSLAADEAGADYDALVGNLLCEGLALPAGC